VVIPESPGNFGWLEKTGSLANVAASLLTTIGVKPPAWMAASLLKPLAEGVADRGAEPDTASGRSSARVGIETRKRKGLAGQLRKAVSQGSYRS